ncbi:Cof-type HAD-IIB family hydrolase [Effusibacillus lacus]|uniref:Hydrolase n=1 Tax=Effusibacillus lacus TaxID=1348429 RepID=A0A292YNP6_9BACL|nr:Cof-type HAD-IIB family hydrolase [Effusibacillus lacus]GAX90816.1 hydrolase [Effusibacillus lacus]
MARETTDIHTRYKLVAIDLDDTLLRQDLSISERNREAIRLTIKRGVTVTIATGRMYASASRFARQLELDVPLITYQGALIKTSLTGEVLYEKLLEPDVALAAIDLAKTSGLHVQAYADDALYTQKENKNVRDYAELVGVSYRVADLHEIAKRGTPKVLYSGDPDFLDRFAKEVQRILGDRANVFKSKPYFLEVTHPQATKGQALDFLVQRLGINREQVIAMGDSYNDLDMIEYAGLGIVMENAPEPIRRSADYITGHHEQDGVAEALDRFILQV